MEIKSDSHETWKCADPELDQQICCFPYEERSDVPRLQQVEQKDFQSNRAMSVYFSAIKCDLTILTE
jgi:hypothetical protein